MSQKKEETLDVVDYVDKFGQWVEKNSKNMIGAFAVFALAVGCYWAFSMYKNSKINSIAKSAGMVNRRIDLLEKAISEVKNKEDAEYKSKKSVQVEEIQALLSNLVQKYPDQSMTDLSVVKWASFLEKEKNDDKALEVLSKVKPSPKRELSGIIMFFKAQLLARKNETEKVKGIYEEVINAEGWKVFHAEALIQKALILESEGQSQDAMALLKKAKDKNKGSQFSKDANKYLKFLKLKSSSPELFKAS